MSENDVAGAEQQHQRPQELEDKADEIVESGPADTGEGGKGPRVETGPTGSEGSTRGEGSEHPQAGGGQAGG